MTKQTEALRMAIEVIEAFERGCDIDDYFMDVSNALDVCKEALAETQEPVAWNEEEFNAIAYAYRTCPIQEVELVSQRYQELVDYVLTIATPPSREWVGLSDAEIDAIFPLGDDVDVLDVARGIEKALREKNT